VHNAGWTTPTVAVPSSPTERSAGLRRVIKQPMPLIIMKSQRNSDKDLQIELDEDVDKFLLMRSLKEKLEMAMRAGYEMPKRYEGIKVDEEEEE